MLMSTTITLADYSNPTHQAAIIELLDEYARDPMGGGEGLSTAMLKEVEKIAQQRGCCKLTLEVLEGNSIARNAYAKFGFSGYELDPAMGKALFWEKPLA
jgi:ribosomal protein S18 acetylase RimI-like enzyme